MHRLEPWMEARHPERNLQLVMKGGGTDQIWKEGWQMADEGKNNQRTKNNGDLPESVLIEILVRLPIKSLFRFRSVLKALESTAF